MLFDLVFTNSDWIQTVIRVILGVIFFAHGAQKLLGWLFPYSHNFELEIHFTPAGPR